MNSLHQKLTYKNAGVDIQVGDALVHAIKPLAARTRTAGVLAGLGGFGALFELPLDRYQKPVLVSGTDGVGTKLKLAYSLNCHHTVGIDLVAMCVNDIIVQGAEPLYFMDYFATSKLELNIATTVIEGICRGCEMAGIALVGGETAEMPGMYVKGEYDLAGFCVGIVEKDRIIDSRKVKLGDKLIGIASSGIHSNGFSLIRSIINVTECSLGTPFHGRSLGEALLEPTKIYVKPLLDLFNKVDVHGAAHITGGGMTENIPRLLPQGLEAQVLLNAWELPAIFQWIQLQGSIPLMEMLTTFNCGVGMVVCVAPEDVDATIACLDQHEEKAFLIGEIIEGKNRVSYCE